MANPIYHSAYTAAQIEALIAHGVPIIQTGTWWTWDISAGAYVDTGVNAQGSTAWADIADEFDDSVDYAIGDIVIYSGSLYVCTSAHSAGAWDASNFTRTTVDEQKASWNALWNILPTETDSGNVAYTAIGADGAPLKSVSMSNVGDFAVEPDLLLGAANPHAVAYQSTQYLSPRSIIFPVVGGTEYTVTTPVSTTLRIGSFADYPKAGDTPIDYNDASSATSVSLTTSATAKWVMCQLLIDNNGVTFASATASGFGISPTPVWVENRVHICGKNLLAYVGISRGYDGNGAPSVGSARHSACFPVKAGEKYTWSVATASASNSNMVWYDADFNIISVASTNRQLPAGAVRLTVTAPVGAVWATITVWTGQGNVQFERGEAPTDYEAYNGSVSASIPKTTLGANHVWADAGDVTAVFRCDIAGYVANH